MILPTLNASIAASMETSPGLFNGPALFNVLVISLVELGVVFWLGAQLWRTFIIELAETRDRQQRSFYRKIVRSFEHLFSIPLLLILLFANVGILVGQVLMLIGTTPWWGQAFAPTLLYSLVERGQFGTYWMMREGIVLLALLIAAYLVLFKKRPAVINVVYPWINLALGVALSGTLALSGHAVTVESTLIISSVIVDWLHVLAVSLWVGGMFYLTIVCLPLLKGKMLQERISPLLRIVSDYISLAIIGVGIMAATGSSNASAHLHSWQQVFTTPYGLTLIVKLFLVVCMVLIDAVLAFRFRPDLRKAYHEYGIVLEAAQLNSDDGVSQPLPNALSRREKILEQRIQQQANRLIRMLRWEALLGMVVLLCTGFLIVSAG